MNSGEVIYMYMGSKLNELVYRKISCFLSVSQLGYLPGSSFGFAK